MKPWLSIKLKSELLSKGTLSICLETNHITLHSVKYYTTPTLVHRSLFYFVDFCSPFHVWTPDISGESSQRAGLYVHKCSTAGESLRDINSH